MAAPKKKPSASKASNLRLIQILFSNSLSTLRRTISSFLIRLQSAYKAAVTIIRRYGPSLSRAVGLRFERSLVAIAGFLANLSKFKKLIEWAVIKSLYYRKGGNNETTNEPTGFSSGNEAQQPAPAEQPTPLPQRLPTPSPAKSPNFHALETYSKLESTTPKMGNKNQENEEKEVLIGVGQQQKKTAISNKPVATRKRRSTTRNAGRRK